MNFRTPGSFKDVAAFRAHLETLALSITLDDPILGQDGPLGKPLAILGLTIPNRFAIHPMEGWDGTRSGSPSDLTLRRWRRFGQSGAGLIWGGEAFAVRAEGRANPNQLYLHDGDVLADLAKLRGAITQGWKEQGLAESYAPTGLQLTHSGRWARPDGTPHPLLATHDQWLDARVPGADRQELITDSALEALRDDFVRAARLAERAGFDFVDLKACHGYLVHELLGARARPGKYGGDLAGRSRFLLELVEAVKAECPRLAIGVRISLADVVPHAPDPRSRIGRPVALTWEHGLGVDPKDASRIALEEPLQLLRQLRAAGVRLFNITLGSPYTCPHLQRPAAYPPSDGYLPFADPLVFVERHFEATRAAKACVPDAVVVGTGYTYLMEWLPAVAQAEIRRGGVDLVGIGRMVLSYPELPLDVLRGKPMARKQVCRTFSDCTTAPRLGLASGCYPLDPDYRERPEAEILKAKKTVPRS